MESAMAEEENRVDVQQWVDQAIPQDPSKVRLSLVFHKDLVATLQQDIADLHHRLKIADSEYDGTQEMVDDAEDDMRAGIHVNNATLMKMDGLPPMGDVDPGDRLYDAHDTNDNAHDNTNANDDDDDDDDDNGDDEREHALNKISTDHERFFSTYNVLSKQMFTQDSLIESMGSFEALLHLSDNAVTFSEIVANLKMRLKSAKDACSAIRDAMDGLGVSLDDAVPRGGGGGGDAMGALGHMDEMLRGGSLSEEDDDDLERNLFLSNAREILRASDKIVATIDSTMDELNGAKHLIHPDQHKIFALQARIKELQVCLPVHKLKKLAVLKELPRFIKDELSDAKIQKQAEAAREVQRVREQKHGHKKKRTRTLVEDEIMKHVDAHALMDDDAKDGEDSEERETNAEETRIEHYETTMHGVNGCVDALQKCLANMLDTLSAMDSDIEASDDVASVMLLRGSIDAVREDVQTCEDKSVAIDTYYKRAAAYVHPTQNVLITAVHQYVEQKIANDALQKQIVVLQGELCAQREQIAILKQAPQTHSPDEPSARTLVYADPDEDTNDEQRTQQFVQTVVQQLQSVQRRSTAAHQMLKTSTTQDGSDGSDDDDDDDDENKDLSTVKNKSSLSADEIKRLDAELTQVRDTMEELTTQLLADEMSVLRLTPATEYTLRLEQRYVHLKKLYRLKFRELESAKDAVVYTESVLQSKNDEIEELEQRLVRIMTSASSSAETRMEAIDSMAQKTQTYGTVMDLVDENVRTTSTALRAIESVCKEMSGGDATQLKALQTLTKTMRRGLDAVQQEMSGARNFVHPDREMVHALQEEILKLRSVDDDDADDDVDDGDGGGVGDGGGDDDDDEKEREPQKEKEKETLSHVSRNSRVHFKSKTSRNVGFTADAATSNGLLASNAAKNRRTKSVHEIAWSKFNAGHETNMEDLEKKERQVLEEEIRADILDVVKQEYDDRYDKAVADVTHELQQSLREEIRAEYEDLLAHVSRQNSPAQQQQQQQEEQQPIVVQNVQDTRSASTEAAEKAKENENTKQALQEQLASSTRQMQDMKHEYEQEMDTMKNTHQDSLQTVRADLDGAIESKLQLIQQASIEINALRQQIRQYTKGDWNGVVALR